MEAARLESGPTLVAKGAPGPQDIDIATDGFDPQTKDPSKLLRTVQCRKHPQHRNFVQITRLSTNHLPKPFQNEDWVELIRLKGQFTVKLSIRYTSQSRTEDLGYTNIKGTNRERGGTGTAFLLKMKDELTCSCSEFGLPHKVSGVFKVMTAAHLVLDDDEARNTEVLFFLDDENDQSQVVRGKGIRVSYIDVDNNLSVMECQTHDLHLYSQLENYGRQREALIKKIQTQQSPSKEEMVVLISHPHGSVKHVTVGRLLEAQREGSVRVTQDGIPLTGCTLTYTTPTCTGSGGGSVNLMVYGVGCEAFAPHCGRDTNRNQRDSNEEANISGQGWIIAK